uniref:Uncharacterized protein n=1 Tax=Ixodes ricinus TaxID=34613 RepID=A0A6B0VAK9_IXORI
MLLLRVSRGSSVFFLGVAASGELPGRNGDREGGHLWCARKLVPAEQQRFHGEHLRLEIRQGAVLFGCIQCFGTTTIPPVLANRALERSNGLPQLTDGRRQGIQLLLDLHQAVLLLGQLLAPQVWLEESLVEVIGSVAGHSDEHHGRRDVPHVSPHGQLWWLQGMWKHSHGDRRRKRRGKGAGNVADVGNRHSPGPLNGAVDFFICQSLFEQECSFLRQRTSLHAGILEEVDCSRYKCFSRRLYRLTLLRGLNSGRLFCRSWFARTLVHFKAPRWFQNRRCRARSVRFHRTRFFRLSFISRESVNLSTIPRVAQYYVVHYQASF